jgi:hypothetical protein
MKKFTLIACLLVVFTFGWIASSARPEFETVKTRPVATSDICRNSNGDPGDIITVIIQGIRGIIIHLMGGVGGSVSGSDKVDCGIIIH